MYYHDWQRVKKARPANEGVMLPNVAGKTVGGAVASPRNTLNVTSGTVIAVHDAPGATTATPAPQANLTTLPFDEEAKLVYGVVISLRNMAKKLSGR